MKTEHLLLTTENSNRKKSDLLRVVAIGGAIVATIILFNIFSEIDAMQNRGFWSRDPKLSDLTIEGWIYIIFMIALYVVSAYISRYSIAIRKSYIAIYEENIVINGIKNTTNPFMIKTEIIILKKEQIINVGYQQTNNIIGNALAIHTNNCEYRVPITEVLYLQISELLKNQ